jgi:hypothetical protein
MHTILQDPPLFTRSGSEQKPNAKTESGALAWRHQENCHRCGGAGGSEAWRYTGWTCYQCGGTGKGAIRVDRLYSEGALAKLNATRDAKRAKIQAARQVVIETARAERAHSAKAWLDDNAAAIECIRGAFELARDESYAKNSLRKFLNVIDDNNACHWIDTALAIAVEVYAKADDIGRSQHFGTIGERQNVTFEVTFFVRFESHNYGWPASYLTVGRTPEGNVVVYKGSHRWDKGETVTAKWTIKDHDERDGVAQTVLARPTFQKSTEE